MTDDSTPEWVSLTDAARLLTAEGDRADRSTLSRYCDQHGIEKRRQGRTAFVDLNALRQHRRENYTREVMSGRALPPELPQQPPTSRQISAPASASHAAPLPASPSAEVRDLDPARREKAAKASMAELELAQRLGQLVLIAEVDAGMADAVAGLRQTANALVRQAAQEMVAELGVSADQVRPVQILLKRFARRMEARFIEGCAQLTGEVREPRSAANARLAELAALSLELRGDAESAKALRADAGQMQARPARVLEQA
ncbi:MAG: hypothetical protein ACXIVO_13760 [Glycocaulis sp.]